MTYMIVRRIQYENGDMSGEACHGFNLHDDTVHYPEYVWSRKINIGTLFIGDFLRMAKKVASFNRNLDKDNWVSTGGGIHGFGKFRILSYEMAEAWYEIPDKEVND